MLIWFCGISLGVLINGWTGIIDGTGVLVLIILAYYLTPLAGIISLSIGLWKKRGWLKETKARQWAAAVFFVLLVGWLITNLLLFFR
mgnify:CR=1 FL=1